MKSQNMISSLVIQKHDVSHLETRHDIRKHDISQLETRHDIIKVLDSYLILSLKYVYK